MKTKNKIFIILIMVLSYIGFFGIGLLNVDYNSIIKNPLAIILFILATLVPGVIGIFLVGRSKWISTKGINIMSLLFLVAFLLIHIVLFSLFGKINKITDLTKFIFVVFVCVFAFGLQEIGWIDIVFRRYFEEKGLFKSIVIVGLLKSLAIFPLTMLKGFFIDPNVFAYLSVFLIGLSSFSIFLKYFSKSNILSILFVGLAYGIMSFMNLNIGPWLLIIGFIEVIFIYGIQDLIKVNIIS